MIRRHCLLLVTIVVMSIAAQVQAQQIKNVEEEHGDVVALAEKPRRPLWDAFAEVGFLPSSAIRGSADDVSMTEFRAGFERRFPVSSRLTLTGGFRYSLQDISAPEAAALPEGLHAVSVAAGGEYRVSDGLTVGLRVSPGLSSDFRAVTSDDVRVPVSVNVRYQQSKALTLLGGIIYTGGSRSYPVLPLFGALYMPSEHWILAIGFPRTGVMYRAASAEWYAGVESGRGEYRLHDQRVGANIISYHDLRGAAGVDFSVTRSIKVGVAGGYAFSRRFVFYEGTRDDLRLASVPFGKAQMKIDW